MNQSDDFLDDALRASFAEHARHAPDSDRVADRIIAAGANPTAERAGRRRAWRSWTLPLVAAGAAAVGATVVGVASYQPDPRPPVASPNPAVTRPHSVTSIATATATNPPSTSASPTDTSTLHGVRILDLTFAGVDDGWALASADCILGTGRCTALLRTADGQNWRSMPGARFNVEGVRNCTDPCVRHLRFASDRVGYAYGPDALFMTTDGGATWARQRGLGADALETLNGNVILVRAMNTACPDRCALFEGSRIGSTTWRPVSGPRLSSAVTGVWLARAGRSAVLELTRYDPAKVSDQSATLYLSGDDGATWTSAKDPCPYIGIGYSDNSVAATMATDGTVVIRCVVRYGAHAQFAGGLTISSSDGGRTFATPAYGGKLGPAEVLAAASDAEQFVFAGSAYDSVPRLYRSDDGGDSWTPVRAITGTVSFIGFESARVGRVVANGGRSIWTTRDAGRAWSEVSFG